MELSLLEAIEELLPKWDYEIEQANRYSDREREAYDTIRDFLVHSV